MSLVARTWLILALVAALLAYGGSGDLVRPLLSIAIAVALLLVAFSLRPQFHRPPLAWIALLFLPPLAIALLQVLPLGWHHPWIAEDLVALGTSATVWSIDANASIAALVWLATLAGLALTVCLLARGERVRALAEVLIGVAACTAILGLCLALTATPWPSSTSLTRTRGPFIYPNHAAAFWAACLPLATLIAHRHGGMWRWSAVAVLGVALLLSGSRGGILVATLVMLPLAVLVLPRKRRWWWAVSGALAIGAWLWLIGLGDVADKFTRLRGAEGVTLNGRVTMWQAALPVIVDAGALGSGGNTTIPAYRRSGDPFFADLLVDHLHSDPLEWWLEYGWLGLVVGLAALAATLVRLRPRAGTWDDPGRRVLILGAGAGLLILGLHACGDFIWHSPAVAMTGVLLFCVLALAGHPGREPARARARDQALCAAAAGVLVIGAWYAWDWHVSELRARDVERLARARYAAGLPLDGAEAVTRALATTPASVRLALTRAWLAHAAEDLTQAQARLADAARLAPGDASAWAQRALLAARTGDAQGASVALRRALAWAPAWPDIQQTALMLVARQTTAGQELLPAEQTAAIVTAVLASDHAQPRWFFPLAVQVLGEDQVLMALRSAGPRLAQASEPWLAKHGPVADWMALRRRVAPANTRYPAVLSPVLDQLLGAGTWQPQVPVEREERRDLGELLTTAGLPVPSLLATTLEHDGAPWARWARPLDVLDQETRRDVALLLRSELHRGWARLWADRLALSTRALAGDSAMITRDCPPPVLARLADVAPYGDAAQVVDPTLRRRALLLLERWRGWEWQELPGAGRWAWWYGDGSGQALVGNERWTGLVVDGEWRGWIRGNQDLAPLLGTGLKRVVLLDL
ncbi:MAG: O-antigen ligase family protein [Planctomycetes bacterium]|nr:O-antigen ligase family protein [Planctomycetota bacterium]